MLGPINLLAGSLYLLHIQRWIRQRPYSHAPVNSACHLHFTFTSRPTDHAALDFGFDCRLTRYEQNCRPTFRSPNTPTRMLSRLTAQPTADTTQDSIRILHACLTFPLFLDFLYPELTPPTITRLVPSISVNLGESWSDHSRPCGRTQSIFWFRMCMAYAWSRSWLLWSLRVPWFNVVLSCVCSVFCSAPPRTQSSDPGYKLLWYGTLTGSTNTARFSRYRSTEKTFGGNSRINDPSLPCQPSRPTIARLPISPTKEISSYRKSEPFLEEGSCSDLLLTRERD
ncbi:hypothetical protein MS3_00000349 [Schistosoma haematobium]|uniref:Uncharacterized protein n=1 Tax=Schistosoma haematobium TaxID=6185 RepID=A0A922LV44_SCHHA|nr:hypothetical protein MS3_00000349 [Schistosoma haematobium]KAH9594614.1 hypothetical protein MS3_00000349 [Schistosoma haematobium]